MRGFGKVLLAILFGVLVIEIIIIAPMELEKASEFEVDLMEEEIVGNQVEQSMTGVHLVESRNEEKEWELWADNAVGFKKKNNDVWALKKVRALFFGKNNVQFEVTGKEGIVETKTKNMKVSGNVITKSSNGYIFKTEEVEYSSELGLLTSPTDVEMIGPKDSEGYSLLLRGKFMSANLFDSVMEVSKNVHGQKVIKEGKVLNIQSQRAQFSGKSNYARFIGNVIMDLETMRITGPEAKFQYDKESDLVSSVFIKGGVRVSDTDKWATSENVRVQFDKDKFIFKGNPRVVQNEDELRGETIIFSQGGKKVQVLKARARVGRQRSEKIN